MFENWLILFMILLVIEFCTINLVSIWFAFGALLAMISTFFIESSQIQTIIFLLGSIVCFITIRPIVKKYLTKDVVKTNLDLVVGKTGIVTKDIVELFSGEVKVDGKYWTAIANEEIKEGSRVEILAIEGVKLVVKKEIK